ncbi:flagellin [Paenibacillus selenitireducens]|uniref:Flagellin n=1 Tax=Paenibacillus selenitireducens TaxID=1324314 RepID=A0A1T2X705_9BACL|nr:flagellin [Paenibacillus selenitireducens]OPA75659.1 flagellin [Paenibacillus selenitireducens]
MIINHNLNAMNAHRNLQGSNIAQGKSSEKLSSGYKINRAADDAAGLSISEKMRTQIRGLNQAQSNVQDGVSLVQTAEGAMNEVSDMLSRMKELAVKASNGTYNASDLGAIDAEYKALSSAINNVANKTKFNGISLLNTAANASVSIQMGDNKDDEIAINLTNITTASLALGSTIGNTASAKAAMALIDSAIGSVNTARSNFGAVQNQLEHTFNNLGATTENLQAAESRVRDTDMAKEMMNYTKLNILQQASTSMLAQANQAPQGVLQLIR